MVDYDRLMTVLKRRDVASDRNIAQEMLHHHISLRDKLENRQIKELDQAAKEILQRMDRARAMTRNDISKMIGAAITTIIFAAVVHPSRCCSR